MKKNFNKKDAQNIIKKAKRNQPKFLEYMEKMEPIIRKATTIKPEDGLRKMD